jgi:hypothetical protein
VGHPRETVEPVEVDVAHVQRLAAAGDQPVPHRGADGDPRPRGGDRGAEARFGLAAGRRDDLLDLDPGPDVGVDPDRAVVVGARRAGDETPFVDQRERGAQLFVGPAEDLLGQQPVEGVALVDADAAVAAAVLRLADRERGTRVGDRPDVRTVDAGSPDGVEQRRHRLDAIGPADVAGGAEHRDVGAVGVRAGDQARIVAARSLLVGEERPDAVHELVGHPGLRRRRPREGGRPFGREPDGPAETASSRQGIVGPGQRLARGERVGGHRGRRYDGGGDQRENGAEPERARAA